MITKNIKSIEFLAERELVNGWPIWDDCKDMVQIGTRTYEQKAGIVYSMYKFNTDYTKMTIYCGYSKKEAIRAGGCTHNVKVNFI